MLRAYGGKREEKEAHEKKAASKKEEEEKIPLWTISKIEIYRKMLAISNCSSRKCASMVNILRLIKKRFSLFVFCASLLFFIW